MGHELLILVLFDVSQNRSLSGSPTATTKVSDSQEELLTPGVTPERSKLQNALKAVSSPTVAKVIFCI